MDNLFTKDIDELVLYFNAQKDSIVRFIRKNFTENTHYAKKPIINKILGRGGHNKIHVYLTEETFELVKNTYNLKHRYVKHLNKDCEHKNVVMSIENQTIGFLENAFNGVYATKRQQKIGPYYIDLYFNDYNLAIECDEYGHNDRDLTYEKTREQYLLDQKITILRYNPNTNNFDLSLVIRTILNCIVKGIDEPKIIVAC